MIKRALCVGNAKYPEGALKNSANDATDLVTKLEALGFSCRLCIDATSRSMDDALIEFESDLSTADVGLFFFAGHGMQISGENYLAAIDTDFHSESFAKHSSLSLNKVIDVLDRGDNATSIIILDACRNNPYERRWRGGESLGLAPVFAPKGTIIAYATSPGEKASDGKNRNGAFTSALLKHIENQNLTIEDLFKRVRNTLSAMTSGKQTSWEHTSLMGDFLFNPSVLTGEFIAEYSSQAKSDANFHVAGSCLREVIGDLKSHTWDPQNAAVSKLASVEWTQCGKDDLFVLGRNLYQAACGDSRAAKAYLSYLSQHLSELEKEVAFHVLNGMLYEIYFDSSDRFRDKKKVAQMERIFALEGDERFRLSFQFIQQSLRPYQKQLFYVPGTERPVIVDIVVNFNKANEFEVKRIIYESQDIFYSNDGVTLVNNYGFTSSNMEELSTSEYETKLASQMVVPRNRLLITFSDSRAKDRTLLVPYSAKIQPFSS